MYREQPDVSCYVLHRAPSFRVKLEGRYGRMTADDQGSKRASQDKLAELMRNRWNRSGPVWGKKCMIHASGDDRWQSHKESALTV